jgi:hypothetical protein
MEDFRRQYVMEHFAQLTPEEQDKVLQALPPERRLAGLAPEQRLAGLPPEQRLAGLSEEQMEQVRQYLDQLSTGRPVAGRKPRRKK